MENSALSKTTVSFGLALAVCAVFNALLVIAKEKSKAVSDLMQRITGHHWITHVIVVLIFFIGLGWVLSKTRISQEPQMSGRRLANIVVAGVVSGVVIILGFYLIVD